MNLIRGDENNLEGRVLVYAKFKEPPKQSSEELKVLSNNRAFDNNIFALYTTTKPSDLIEFGVSEEEIPKYMEKLDINFPMFKDFKAFSNTASIFVEIDQEADALMKKGDVIYAGEFERGELAISAVSYAKLLYQTKLANQWIKQEGFQVENQSNVVYDENITHKYFPRIMDSGIYDYIINNFVFNMLDALDEQKPKAFEKARTQFLKFSEGSDFYKHVPELIKIVATGGVNGDYKLYDNETKLMSAIHEEAYEFCTEIFNRIQILKEKQKNN